MGSMVWATAEVAIRARDRKPDTRERGMLTTETVPLSELLGWKAIRREEGGQGGCRKGVQRIGGQEAGSERLKMLSD